MAWKAKIPIKRGQKVIFLIFGHVDLSRSPRYYGCLYIPIRVLDCPKHNPKVLYLDLKFFFFLFLFLFVTLWFFLSPLKIALQWRPRWRVVVPKYYRSSAAGNIWCLFSQLLLAPVFPGFASHTDVFPPPSDIFRMLKLTFGTKSEWLVPKVRPDALHMGCSNTPI